MDGGSGVPPGSGAGDRGEMAGVVQGISAPSEAGEFQPGSHRPGGDAEAVANVKERPTRDRPLSIHRAIHGRRAMHRAVRWRSTATRASASDAAAPPSGECWRVDGEAPDRGPTT